MALINFKFAKLTFKDAGSNTFQVVFGNGNFSYSEGQPREYILERGQIAGAQVRDGDDEPVAIDIQGSWTEQRGASGGPVTLEEALKKVGGASAWVSTGDVCEPYAVDLQFEYGAECSGTVGHRLLFPDFRYEKLDYDAKAGTVKITGKAKCTSPTIIRTAVT